MIKKLCMALVALALGTVSSFAAGNDSIYVENTTLAAGQSGVIKVMINNNSSVQSVGVYLTLPSGFTFDASAVALDATMAPATNDTIAANTVDGATRVAILGKGGEAFSAVEGTLFTIPVTIDSSVAAGDYELQITNAELSTTSNAIINVPDAVAKITVSSGVKGDVNGDGEVNIADVNAIITVMCGGAENPRADVNGDGEVNIADVNAVITIMCGGE